MAQATLILLNRDEDFSMTEFDLELKEVPPYTNLSFVRLHTTSEDQKKISLYVFIWFSIIQIFLC
jgi:hypothetical protein